MPADPQRGPLGLESPARTKARGLVQVIDVLVLLHHHLEVHRQRVHQSVLRIEHQCVDPRGCKIGVVLAIGLLRGVSARRVRVRVAGSLQCLVSLLEPLLG